VYESAIARLRPAPADSLLTEDGVVDVRLVDVLDRDRASVCRDPAREPHAQGDAHVAFDLLLDALGGPGDELVGLLVEEQDRRRVGIECGADAPEELVEELVKGEMGQRRLHH
jgi:hypothetical protein